MSGNDLSPFGALLRTFRKRRGLTQQQLAEAVGVHRNAISRWEQGEFLPEYKGMVLELARHLHLDDREARQLLEASFTALTPPWSVPLLRNPLFTGREEILADLHARLGMDQVIALTQSYALHGLGGVGKTQIALEYAHRHALDYSAVFWIEAETVEQIQSSMLRVAELLQLPERQEADQQRVVAAVQRWLANHPGWLLIWDNLEDLDLLPRWLPPARPGAILITTRSQALGTLAQGIDLRPMEQEEALLFVLRRARVLEPGASGEQVRQLAVKRPTEYAAAEELVREMAGLPLALDQAGAYIEETRCSAAAYVQRYHQQRARLLNRRGTPGGDHPHSVSTTFLLAMERVEQEEKAAVELLRVCAFLHADAIPEELFVMGAAHLGPLLDPLATDPSQFDAALAALQRLSLVQRQAETRTLSIHRLVQAVLREQISEQEQVVWQQRVIAALNAVFPGLDQMSAIAIEEWPRCQRLLTQIFVCADLIERYRILSLEAVDLLHRAGAYLRLRGQYQQAEQLLKRALAMDERASGGHSLDLALILASLGRLYVQWGRYYEAEMVWQRAYTLREQVLGQEHLDTVKNLHDLAYVNVMLGRYKEAESLYQRVLEVFERTLDPYDPSLAELLDNLGVLSFRQKRYEQAEYYHQRSIAICEQTVGAEHPDTANVLNNLALVYMKQERYGESEQVFQRVLGIFQRTVGDEHSYAITTQQNLALVYLSQKKYKAAEEHFLHILRMLQGDAASNSSTLAVIHYNLGSVYLEQGAYQEAEQYLRQALRIHEEIFPSDHPTIVFVLFRLARLSTTVKRYEEAEAYYRRALEIRESKLGSSHPDVTEILLGYADLLRAVGRQEEAHSLEQRAQSIQTSLLITD